MKVVIYKQDDGTISVLSPTPECLERHSILDIAVKDVPFGKQFKIVEESDLPADIPQEFWSIDDKELNDGIGGRSNEFNQD
ncbi:hypothetical protein [Vibrio cholerae]|uniref:hypothetical protein n=1 Tax=Vibrio cholerae TaxID=666 RepID=UPI0018F0CB28|nr:hypothetical protein [Vibrio cholerae]MBJ6908402.1 hypothetical protein [Vibrio cholerae]MBJ6922855.1 hypothetical protein [Vibrio cholerae]